LDHELYPVLLVKPDEDAKVNVTPAGGLTNPIVTNRVADELKLDKENPLAD
jgi:hypothetical protein